MNEERETRSFPVKYFLIRLLLIIIFVFFLIWLFPVNKLYPLLDEKFINNIETMKDAATSYYTIERLPNEVGGTEKLTLQEMLDNHLLINFTDKNGKTCNTTKSYVEITKMENEYQMKVNLSCGKEEDYIIVYLGCYDYCQGFICEKKEVKDPACVLTVSGTKNKKNQFVSNATVSFKSKTASTGALITGYGLGTTTTYAKNNSYKVTKNGTTTVYGYIKDSNNKTAICKIVVEKVSDKNVVYKYQYKKTISKQYSNWSDWSKDIEYTSSSNITWGKQELIWNEKTESKQVITGYKEIKDFTKPIYGYTYDNVIGSYTQTVCDGYTYLIKAGGTTAYAYGNWKKVETKTFSTPQSDTESTKYVYRGMDYNVCKANCTANPAYQYDVYKRTVTSASDVKAYLDVKCNEVEKTIPIYGTKKYLAGYVTEREPIYETKYYYHYKTRTITQKEQTLIKWSTSSNDKTLINQGYKYTGYKVVA